MSYFVELQEHNGLSRCLNNNFHDHRVIIFYKPGCGPCSNLLGQLTNYIDNSQNHKQRIKDQKLIILTINCADPKFKNLLTQNKVNAAPTVFISNTGMAPKVLTTSNTLLQIISSV